MRYANSKHLPFLALRHWINDGTVAHEFDELPESIHLHPTGTLRKQSKSKSGVQIFLLQRRAILPPRVRRSNKVTHQMRNFKFHLRSKIPSKVTQQMRNFSRSW